MMALRTNIRSGFAVSAVGVGGLALIVAVGTVALFAVPEMGMAILSTTLLGGITTAVLVVTGAVLTVIAFLRHEPRGLAITAAVLAVLAAVTALGGVTTVFGFGGLS
ncbi:hypothetical protein GCM10027421_36320 [Microbacterium shaanxiense]